MAQEQEALEPYAEDTPLTYLFGNHAKVKVLSALISEEGHDLNLSDIARLAGVARSTVYDHLDDLVGLGVVEHTRDVGRSSMYRLDPDSDIAEFVRRLEGLTLKELLDREEPAQKTTA